MELNDRIDPVTRSSRCVHSYRRQSCTPFHENAQYYCDRKTVRMLQENRPDKVNFKFYWLTSYFALI